MKNKKEKQKIYQKELRRREKEFNKKRAKILTNILIVIVSLLVVAVIFNLLRSSEECSQKDIENGLCECEVICNEVVRATQGMYLPSDYDKKCTETTIDKYGRETKHIYASKCYSWKKKSECQLKLEQKGILGEECICLEEIDKINSKWLDKCCSIKGEWVICYSANETYYYKIDEINIEECNKINPYTKICVKAREKICKEVCE